MGVLECWMVLRGLTMTRKLERVGQAHSSMEARWFFADCGASRQTVRIAQRDLHGPLGRSCLPFMEDFGVTDLAWQSAYHEVSDGVIAGQWLRRVSTDMVLWPHCSSGSSEVP